MVTRVLQAAIALWAIALAYRFRKRSPELIFVPAIVGGLLASPYLHLDDLVMLGLAGWLYLRVPQRPRWSWAYVLALVIAAEGMTEWGPLPMIAGEIGALVLLGGLAEKTGESGGASASRGQGAGGTRRSASEIRDDEVPGPVTQASAD
jgi:hypothetical protein